MKEVFKYKYDDLFNAVLTALHNLGGSGSVSEIEEQVSAILNLSDEEISDLHRGNTTKLTYRLAWARNYLKRYGLIENSARAVWALTELGLKTKNVHKEQVKKQVKTGIERIEVPEKSSKTKDTKQPNEIDEQELAEFGWQERLIEELQQMEPSAFERLCQRLLRELGFQNVEVTGRSNDGGIDGKGILRLGGVLSFHVLFQAKRYKQSVSLQS